mgnify:CR=1 FL=1
MTEEMNEINVDNKDLIIALCKRVEQDTAK